jgi:glycosyltransferase involved in cell wall biosynthesis
MKASILYLVPDLIAPPGGIARYCRLVSRSLLAAGAQLTVIALHDRPIPAGQPAATDFEGMDYHACGGSRLQFVALALRLALEQRPRLVLVGHPNFSGLGDLVRRLGRTPMIVFVYGVDVWQPLPPLTRRGLRAAERVISISRFTAEKAVAHNGLAPERIRILHNCLDPVFDHAPDLTAQDGALSLLTVARISEAERYKGHEYVLRALPGLLSSFPRLIYDVVGDGEGRPALEQLAADQGVARTVRFHGAVSEEELQRLYSRASVFIMPSAREGFGFVFLEAMAHGLPVIGGNQDATTEVVADGETGLLVVPGSTEQIAQAASRLLADPDLRQRMGQAGRRRVEDRFSFDRFQATLRQHLAEVGLF